MAIRLRRGCVSSSRALRRTLPPLALSMPAQEVLQLPSSVSAPPMAALTRQGSTSAAAPLLTLSFHLKLLIYLGPIANAKLYP